MNNENAVNSNDRLSFTLFMAAAFHALFIFGVTFKINSGDTIAPTLNITLATHKSVTTPEKADFLAQINQEASGTSDKIKDLSTKQNAEIEDVNIRDTYKAPQEKAKAQNQRLQQQITTTSAQKDKALNIKDDNETQEDESSDGQDAEIPWTNPEIASLRAKLDKLKQDLAKQPRIRRLTSVSTKASYDAQYLYSWSQKIEAIGNKNFPKEALEKQIFGNLRLSVIIYPNGTIKSVEVLQSSGHSILDKSAIQIVRLASPFPPFPKEIRKNTDQLEIIRTWRFEITGLSTAR